MDSLNLTFLVDIPTIGVCQAAQTAKLPRQQQHLPLLWPPRSQILSFLTGASGGHLCRHHHLWHREEHKPQHPIHQEMLILKPLRLPLSPQLWREIQLCLELQNRTSLPQMPLFDVRYHL